MAELWSLLNFILPEIFDDVAAFQESYAPLFSIWSTSHSSSHRFKIPTLSNGLTETRNTVLIHKLHQILRPFLLRRLKVDVERSLPPKKEYVLYAPLTERQRELYDAVVKGCLRGVLAGARSGQDAALRERERMAREIEEDEKLGRIGTRTRMSRTSFNAKSVADIGAEHQLKAKSASLHSCRLPTDA